jgi:hypothetical protein
MAGRLGPVSQLGAHDCIKIKLHRNQGSSTKTLVKVGVQSILQYGEFGLSTYSRIILSIFT